MPIQFVRRCEHCRELLASTEFPQTMVDAHGIGNKRYKKALGAVCRRCIERYPELRLLNPDDDSRRTE